MPMFVVRCADGACNYYSKIKAENQEEAEFVGNDEHLQVSPRCLGGGVKVEEEDPNEAGSLLHLLDERSFDSGTDGDDDQDRTL